ncbi:oxidoreductase [Vibrio natriegens]|uniref:SDR family NAD(P)-dependent oxidoreductase n=1 Tax=Vibrio natriegens TaxID=691 RepID=UPI00080451A6|nr:SDR family oxidoreductase [Vibrio natriegens]ANQ24679.1 oxidoreductase [Vibrio natriegens]
MKKFTMIIVGGASGLGAKIAEIAADSGVSTIGILDVNAEAAEQTAVLLREKGVTAASASCDISRKAEAQQGFTNLLARLAKHGHDGQVDTLINTAAIFPRKPVLDISDDDWDASNAVNVKGTYHMMVTAIRHMQKQERRDEVRGRIVNITSVDAFKAHPQNAHYAATKAAVVSLTKSLAHEVAPDGILINSVAPAGIATQRATELGIVEELAKASPLGRGAKPHEIAEWVLMAGGPKNSFMTGENIIVSGGYIYA